MKKKKKPFGPTKFMREKAELEMERGGKLEDDGEKWAPEQADWVLEMWLDGKGLNTMATRTERSAKSVQTLIWKVAHAWGNWADYAPAKREDRTGRPYNRRETELFNQMLRPKKKGKEPVTPEHAAKVLGRSVKEIKKKLEPKRLGGGFGLL